MLSKLRTQCRVLMFKLRRHHSQHTREWVMKEHEVAEEFPPKNVALIQQAHHLTQTKPNIRIKPEVIYYLASEDEHSQETQA